MSATKENAPLLAGGAASQAENGQTAAVATTGSHGGRSAGSGSEGEAVLGVAPKVALASLYTFAVLVAHFFLATTGILLMKESYSLPYNAGYFYFTLAFVAGALAIPILLVVSMKASGEVTCHPGEYSWIMLGRLVTLALYVLSLGYGGYFVLSVTGSGCATNIQACGTSTKDLVQYMVYFMLCGVLAIWDACFSSRYRGRNPY